MKDLTRFYENSLDGSAVSPAVNSLRRHVAILTIVFLIISLLLWSGFSQIDQHVRATGKVVPAGNSRTVQHLEGGIVMRILVAEGDEVKMGDPLFEIANTRVRTTLQEGKLQQLSLMIRRERLLAEDHGADELVYSSHLAQTQPDFVAAEQALFGLRRQEHLERLIGFRTKREQKKLEIEALTSKVNNMVSELAILERQAQIKKNLYDSGVVSESSYLQMKGDLRKLQASSNNTQMQIPIVAAEMDQAGSEILDAENSYASSVKSELNEVEVSLSSIQKRLAALSDEVQRSEIVSPIDGKVNQLYVNTEGGVSQPGAPLAEITPAREILVVEGNMSTEDRGKVWPDLKTMTHISAYDYAVYGGLEGSLSYISPDTFTNSDSREFYKIRVALNADRFNDNHIIRPGMTAEINILTGTVSILDALLKPFTRLRGTALREG